MGRWAQRRRAGGGSPSLNSMIRAVQSGAFSLQVTYASDVSADDFTPGMFAEQTDDIVPVAVFQLSPNSLELNFSSELENASELIYIGNVLGTRTPQTIAIEV